MPYASLCAGSDRLLRCRERLPTVFVPALEALPINAIGKIDRPRLKELVLSAARQ